MEESLLRTDYKKHIQVQGGVSGKDPLWGAEPKPRGLSDGPWQGGAGTRGEHRTAEGGSKACPGEVLGSLGHK